MLHKNKCKRFKGMSLARNINVHKIQLFYFKSPSYCLKPINVTDLYDKNFNCKSKVSCGRNKVPKLLLYNLIMLLFLSVCYLTSR